VASPPGTGPAPTRCESAFGGQTTSLGAALVRRYVHLAMSDPACADLSVHRVNKAVRRFINAGLHEKDLVRYVVGYADPTGETAVRNVMRERGGRT
jgi:hypothetical protein